MQDHTRTSHQIPTTSHRFRKNSIWIILSLNCFSLFTFSGTRNLNEIQVMPLAPFYTSCPKHMMEFALTFPNLLLFRFFQYFITRRQNSAKSCIESVQPLSTFVAKTSEWVKNFLCIYVCVLLFSALKCE